MSKHKRSIAIRFVREQFRKNIGFRVIDFGSAMLNIRRMEQKGNFWVLLHSLLMDLGQDQQKHPAVHSGGVSRRRVHSCGSWRY